MVDLGEIQRPLRLKYIRKIEDVITAMDLCDQYNVPDEGLESVDDYINRLKTHYYAQKHGSIIKQVGQYS